MLFRAVLSEINILQGVLSNYSYSLRINSYPSPSIYRKAMSLYMTY